MKCFSWLLTGSVVLCLVIVLLAGCGVSKSEYEALQTELVVVQSNLTNLQAAYDTLNADYQVANNELADLKTQLEQVSETGYFTSSSQLASWLRMHKNLQTSEFSSIFEDYSQARQLQVEALHDGYIINVYVDDDGEGGYWVWCDAYLTTGDIYYWNMLEFGDVHWYGNW